MSRTSSSSSSSALALSSRIAQDIRLDDLASGRVEDKKSRRSAPLSISMGPVIMEAFAAGESLAQAIVSEWKPSYSVTVMPAAEYDALVERSHTDFIGSAADLNDELSTDLSQEQGVECE